VSPERERALMIAHQLEARGIRDRRVLDAMGRVPREAFVPAERRDAAYQDRALPIPDGQTISQPYMVARTLELARIAPDAHVLDVGTGSGYQAAILGELAASVISIERHASLANTARAALERAGYTNITVVIGDGSMGYAPRAPYDAIVVAAASPHVPPELARQLTIGGRLVIPVGPRGQQWLSIVERRAEDDWREEQAEPCVYVPLIGEGGFSDD
jgi:protein-L-isoaspartate(D-aspartate) O-methyltransferase